MDRPKRRELLRRHGVDSVNDKLAFAILVVLAVIFTVAGAFESKLIENSGARLIFWIVLLTLTYGAYVSGVAFATIVFGRRVRDDTFLVALAAVLGATAMGPIGAATLSVFTDAKPFTAASVMVALWHFLSTMPLVAILAHLSEKNLTLAKTGSKLSESLQTSGSDDQTPVIPAATNGEGCRQSPIYMETDDHYVKLVFADHVGIKRSTLAKEIGPWENCGLRIHRSYWVSRDNVAGHARRGRQLRLRLNDGQILPVGRSYEKEVIALFRPAPG